jgi:hypothetical protein
VAPTTTTIKKLFSLSGNQCAFPGCKARLVDASGVLIGEVCHICADKPGGNWYDPRQTDVEREALANLIVLCPTHHTVIDNDDAIYTVSALRDMKQQHEAKSIKAFVISDDLAARIVAFMLALRPQAHFAKLLVRLAVSSRPWLGLFRRGRRVPGRRRQERSSLKTFS